MNKEKLESLALEFKKSSEDWEILKELVEGETDKILETETSKVSESVTKSKFAGTQVNTKYQVSKTSEKKESSEIPEYVFEGKKVEVLNGIKYNWREAKKLLQERGRVLPSMDQLLSFLKDYNSKFPNWKDDSEKVTENNPIGLQTTSYRSSDRYFIFSVRILSMKNGNKDHDSKGNYGSSVICFYD